MGLGLALTLGLSACGGSDSSGAAAPDGTQSAALPADVPTLETLWTKGTIGEPPTSGPAPEAGKSIYWISCGQQAPDCAAKSEAGKAAVEAIGWKFNLIDGNLGTAGAYADGIRQAIAAKADAIVLDAFPCSSVQQPLEEAKAAGIKVVGMENLDCVDADPSAPKLLTVDMPYNETDTTQPEYWAAFGRFAADYIIGASEGKAKIIFNAGEGDPQKEFLNNGFTEELKKCSGCEIVDTVKFTNSDSVPNGPWVNALRASLLRHPEATAVMIPFEFFAVTVGGAQAITDAGRKICSGTPPFSSDCVIGFGGVGSSDGFDFIRDGKWTASTSVRPNAWVAWAAVDSLNRAFEGEPAVPQGVGMITIDKDHNLPAEPGSNWEPDVDYVSAYKSAWGVS
ncbi:hypothetical protein ASC77_23685 [Nocardioides sp. Root1257]|nr:hypothetical protein ASC77_23685 [Nocardioides sp. Root1257]KRC39921.1 hypothetical protein ASE24_23480 [Nocardioides sp. Root224]